MDYRRGKDKEFLEGLRRRDKEALSAIYERYAGKVFALALRILGRWEDAEEVTQEAFLKLWRAPEAFRGDRGEFAPWFLTLARHLAIDELRRRRRRSHCKPINPQGP